jgi:hypothetical protein
MSERRQYERPRVLPSGKIRYVLVSECECRAEERRGPPGGCCGQCAGAIPGFREQPAPPGATRGEG